MNLRLRVVALLALCALLPAACSSTSRETAGRPSANETAPLSGLPSVSGSASTQATSSYATKAKQPLSASSTSGGTAKTGLAPKFAATSIKIGILVWDPSKSNKLLSSSGSSNLLQGDNQAGAQAVVDYLNSHGGIAGLKVIPVYAKVDPASSNYAGEWQKACATFTEDNHVFAVVSGAGIITGDWRVLATCLANDRKIYVASRIDAEPIDQVQFNQFAPYMYGPSLLRGERWGSVIDLLVAGGYFDPGYKLGVVLADQPSTNRMFKATIVPRLAAHGIKITDTATMSPMRGVQDAAQWNAQSSNAVVRFSSEKINHVLFLGGETASQFAPAAEQQGFRPRYALTSLEIPEITTGQAPKAQLHRALLAGWRPTVDVASAQDPNDNPAESLCASIIRQAGVNAPSRNAFAIFAEVCDGLFFMKAGLERATVLSPAGFRAGVDALGTAYRSPVTFSTRFGRSRFDGVNTLRLASYDDGCGCFKYTGLERPAG